MTDTMTSEDDPLGDVVTLTILRDGRKKNVELTFGEREKD